MKYDFLFGVVLIIIGLVYLLGYSCCGKKDTPRTYKEVVINGQTMIELSPHLRIKKDLDEEEFIFLIDKAGLSSWQVREIRAYWSDTEEIK